MSDAFSRLRLPLLLFSLLLLVGGSKLDAVRPLEGQVVALLIPVIAVLSGVGPFRDAHSSLRNLVFALGGLVLVLAELGSYRVVFEDANRGPRAERHALARAGHATVRGVRGGWRSAWAPLTAERVVRARDRVRALLPRPRRAEQLIRQRICRVLDRAISGRWRRLVRG